MVPRHFKAHGFTVRQIEETSEHLTNVLNNTENIVRTQANGRVVRELILMGPLGGAKLETAWRRWRFSLLTQISIFVRRPTYRSKLKTYVHAGTSSRLAIHVDSFVVSSRGRCAIGASLLLLERYPDPPHLQVERAGGGHNAFTHEGLRPIVRSGRDDASLAVTTAARGRYDENAAEIRWERGASNDPSAASFNWSSCPPEPRRRRKGYDIIAAIRRQNPTCPP